MTSRVLLRTAALLAALLAAAPALRAESRAEEDVTPLALARGADLVVVASALGPDTAPPRAGVLGTLRVEEVLRGAAAPAALLEVAGDPALTDARLPEGRRCVAFLERRADGAFEPRGGALGLVAVGEAPPGQEEPTLALVRAVVLETPSRVLPALVRAAAAPGRFQSGAALDLLREPGLLGGISDADGERLAAAFASTPSRDRARAHLARLLGRLAPEGAVVLLVDAVLAEDGDPLKGAVGLALRDLGDDGAARLLAERTAGADAARRARAAAVLGLSGLPGARSPLEALLGSAEPEVRVEAASALGLLRAPESAPALLRRLRGVPGGPAAEADTVARRALLWALAQTDAPEGWEALRAVAADGADSERRFAEETLLNPRRPFVP